MGGEPLQILAKCLRTLQDVSGEFYYKMAVFVHFVTSYVTQVDLTF